MSMAKANELSPIPFEAISCELMASNVVISNIIHKLSISRSNTTYVNF